VNNKNPSNLYGWSKYAAEDIVINNGGVALRYFNVYGPGEEHKGQMASVAYQMWTKIVNGEEVKLFPQSPRRDFVYIKDVISANLFAYDNYHSLDMRSYYEVGLGVSHLFESVLEELHIPFTYHTVDCIPKGYQFYTASNRDKWMPNWLPRYSLRRGLGVYLEYLKEMR
jgi:ADP-L-glycero-D-manno-heptose 6-epimerase